MLLILFTLAVLHVHTTGADKKIPRQVVTEYGTFNGLDFYIDPDPQGIFYGNGSVFLGIPFALPPIGSRRFKLPEPICTYDDPVNATQWKPRCPQVPSSFSPATYTDEDCLFLNVFTNNLGDNTTKKPVLFFIHGGTFTNGGADTYDYKGIIRNLVSHDIVVVTTQYRLAVLGFFTTYTADFPANRGLFDQVAALQWVQRFITYFGGDPNRVTIDGQSAGAASVSALTLSPVAKGLFQQSILQSGQILTEYDFPGNPLGNINQVRAEQICGISATDFYGPNQTKLIQNCFATKSSDQLIAFDFKDGNNWCTAFDGAFFPDDPDVLGKRRPNMPTLIGSTHDDSVTFLHGLVSDNISWVGPTVLRDMFPIIRPYFNKSAMDLGSSMMMDVYCPKPPPADSDHLGWVKVFTNAYQGIMFAASQWEEARWNLDNGNANVFLYTVEYEMSFCGFAVEGWKPAYHGAEVCGLFYFTPYFESALANGTITKEDASYANHLGKAWADFVKTGNPGWSAASLSSMQFMEIDPYFNTTPSAWNNAANELYNKKWPTVFDNWPLLPMPADLRANVTAEGAKTLATWSKLSTKCQTAVPPLENNLMDMPAVATTTSEALGFRFLILPFVMYYITLAERIISCSIALIV